MLCNLMLVKLLFVYVLLCLALAMYEMLESKSETANSKVTHYIWESQI